VDVKAGRAESWRTLLQRGVDTAAEMSDGLAQKIGAAADPRAKLLRKRRWALRAGWFFTFATGLWTAVTAVLATWSTPVWALIITGCIAAGAAFWATLAWLRYRWLRAEPLPPARTLHRLPPWGSAARQPMAALASAERGLFSLLGVMQRGDMLPADELAEVTRAATLTAAAMASTATEIVSLERAVHNAPQSRAHLTPTIRAFVGQLDAGARQYNEMVTAAAQLVSAAPGQSMTSQRYRHELSGATDRLTGWAQAFDELGQLRRA
jgi:hypothetical protein